VRFPKDEEGNLLVN
jgi:hypothetical protein